MKSTKTKAPTIAEERERIEKTGTIRMDFMQVDAIRIRVMPEKLKAALRPLNKIGDTITLPTLGIAVPAKLLHEAAALMGPDPVEFEACKASERAAPVAIIIRYKSTPDSRSVMTLNASKEQAPDALHPSITGEYTPPAESVIDGWIAKAVSKDKYRPQMQRTYGKFAADGFRIHYDRTAALAMPAPDFSSPELPAMVDKMLYDTARVDNAILAPVDAFLAAMKQAKRANKESVNLFVNGRLDISAQTDNDSIIRNEITDGYQHSGDNVDIRLDPSYLIDALSGMTGEVVIGIGEFELKGARKIYISDGRREAVIMTKATEEA